MRDVHFCKTCDFRLPFCVRTDRAFCGTRCRVWWYRHPGIKRLDFSPGDEIPARRKNGQPKTLAEALVLLEAERARAGELEDAAKRAQTQEGILRTQLAALRDELTEERKQLAALRDELADERKKQAETDLLWRRAEERADEMEASYNSLADDLEKAEEYTSELKEEIESVRRKAEDVRYDLEQEVKLLRRELDEQRPSKESVSAEQEELNRRFEELRIRFEENAQSLMLRDGELTKQRQDFAASERAHQEINATADSMVRCLSTIDRSVWSTATKTNRCSAQRYAVRACSASISTDGEMSSLRTKRNAAFRSSDLAKTCVSSPEGCAAIALAIATARAVRR